MNEIILRGVEVGSLFLAAVGALYFGYSQTKINKRIQKLSDYVAVSCVVHGNPFTFMIQIMNTGKINLYLNKYEIGLKTETFEEAPIICAGTGQSSFLAVPVPEIKGNMKMIFYLTDELGEKYISRGHIVVGEIKNEIIEENGTKREEIKIGISSILNYKTEKVNWKLE